MKHRSRTQLDELAIIEHTRASLRIIATTYTDAPCGSCRDLATTCAVLADGLTHLLKARGPEKTVPDVADLPPWHV
jgi:hypothetical protein